MAVNVDAMVREGINAFKTGRKDEARALLLKATELDQYNEQAWLWLSGLMDAADDQRTCLENVLAINPENERAKQGLAYLTGQTSTGQVSPFSAATPPSSVPPSSAPPSTTSSVEWGMPDEPAPSPSLWNAPPPTEPSPDVLDDWVSNLNLSVSDTRDTASAFGDSALDGSASPFGDFDIDDDMFADGPFSASRDADLAPSTAPAATPRRSSKPAPSERRQSPSREQERDSLLIDRDDDLQLESEESELFGYIPRAIAPTRLPGTRERTPILLSLVIMLLILFNIGAASLFMFTLLT